MKWLLGILFSLCFVLGASAQDSEDLFAEKQSAEDIFEASDFVIGLNAFNEQVIKALELQTTRRVVVLLFPDFNGSYSPLSHFIREQMVTSLVATRSQIVVPDIELNKLASDLGVTPMDLGNTDEFRQLGEKYANEVIVAGTFTNLGNKIALMARIIQGHNGEYGGGAMVYLRKDAEVSALMRQQPVRRVEKQPEASPTLEQIRANQNPVEKESVENTPTVELEPVETAQPESDPVEPEVKDQPARTMVEVKPDTGNLDDQAIYRIARESFTDAKYNLARGYFTQLVERFPESDLADNALYWIGEAYYKEEIWAQSLAAFQRVLDEYPYGNKVPDATMKRGYVEEKQGNSRAAIATMEEVIRRFEDSSVAERAKAKLQLLRATLQ